MHTMTSYLHRHYLVLLLVVVVLSTLLELASSLSAPPSTSSTATEKSSLMAPTTLSSSITPKIITISEKVWRKAASTHSQRIRHLLQPGLLPLEEDTVTNSGSNKSQQKSRRRQQQHYVDDWTGLDPINPIYNFLIEYYGLKGAKGPRRLARWAPNPKLLLDDDNVKGDTSTTCSSASIAAAAVCRDPRHRSTSDVRRPNGLFNPVWRTRGRPHLASGSLYCNCHGCDFRTKCYCSSSRKNITDSR